VQLSGNESHTDESLLCTVPKTLQKENILITKLKFSRIIKKKKVGLRILIISTNVRGAIFDYGSKSRDYSTHGHEFRVNFVMSLGCWSAVGNKKITFCMKQTNTLFS
jgi:hypothetical protein